MARRNFIAVCAMGCAALLATSLHSLPAAAGQAWPAQPLRFVVPFPPGGPTDLFVRTVAGPLGAALGQPVVVENRAGAGGTIGADAVAKAAPDGYTLGLGSAGALMAAPHLLKVPYDVKSDFTYVTSLAQVPAVIAVNAKSEVRDLAQFLALAKEKPGSLNYASAGTGTLVHLAAELLKRETGSDITHVPYKGAAPAITGLLGGQVESIVSDLTPLVPHVNSGAIRILAVMSAERSDILPDVPTMTELGYPSVVHVTEYGTIMPAGTPNEVVERVQRELATILASENVKAAYANMGAVAVSSEPAQYQDNVMRGYDAWGEFIRQSGITMD